jgi:hypothetical protein
MNICFQVLVSIFLGMMECTNKHEMMMVSVRQIYARNLDVHERGKAIQLP